MTGDNTPDARAGRLRKYCWQGLLVLIAWLAVEAATLAPSGLSVLFVAVFWLIQSLGLLIFLPGVRAGRVRSMAWLIGVLVCYGIFAALRITTPGLPGWLAMVELALLTGVLTLAVRYLKLKRSPTH